MDMKKRSDMRLAYVTDKVVLNEQVKCRKILQRLNFADWSVAAGSPVVSFVK